MAGEQPNESPKGAAQPGQVIVPGGQPVTPPPARQPAPQPPTPVPQDSAPQPQSKAAPAEVSGDEISWTASEFIAHDKSSSWYLGLAAGAIALAGIIFLATKDKISAGFILIGALLFGIFAGRKPRQLQYRLNPRHYHRPKIL